MRYYASIETSPGRWTPIVPDDNPEHGFPTYRAAMEAVATEISKMPASYNLTHHEPRGAPRLKILLDVTSVDLNSRDDFLALMAYDPVMKTMFDFARFGGDGGSPDESTALAEVTRAQLLGAGHVRIDNDAIELHRNQLEGDGA